MALEYKLHKSANKL